jgi:hypothetical protein
VPSDCSYVFDLVSVDRRYREAALERHAGYVAAHRETITRGNHIWRQAGRCWSPAEPSLRAAMDQVRAAGEDALRHTVQGLTGVFLEASWRGGPGDREQLAGFAVLFLQWETSFPGQWRRAGPFSPWWHKKQVLGHLARDGVPERFRDQLVRLVAAAVYREHRCEDGGYVALARRLDGLDLRAALADATSATDPVTRLRAGYVQWAIDHLDTLVTPAGWRRWLAESG